jgi:phenylalanyl-tRNA synthetase beta chain
LNFVLDESVTWQQLEDVARRAAGPLLARLSFGGQYRGQQIEADKKSYVVTLSYQAADRTLTHDEVESVQKSVVEACCDSLGAALR